MKDKDFRLLLGHFSLKKSWNDHQEKAFGPRGIPRSPKKSLKAKKPSPGIGDGFSVKI
jgi:hypothetical protein